VTYSILAVKRLLQRNDALLKHGAIVVTAGLLCNVLNYCYQLAMGRMLGPADFGVLGALTSLATVFAVPAETIRTLLMKFTSKTVAAGRSEGLGYAIRHLTLRVVIVSGIGLFGLLAASGGIGHLLRLTNVAPALILGPLFFLQLLSPALEGSLSGLQRFARLGAAQTVAYVAKLASGIALVAVGFSVTGALAAVAVGAGVSLLVSTCFLRDVLWQRSSSRDVQGVSTYSLYAFLAFLFLALLNNLDVILVRRLFTDSVAAGHYVAAMTVARAVYFGAISIVAVMFPKVAALVSSGKGAGSERLLRDTLIYVGLLAGLGALGLNLFPGFVVSVFFGGAYSESAGLVGLMSIGMLFRSLSYTIVLYDLARERTESVLVLAVGVLGEGIGIALLHGSLRGVAAVVTAMWAGVGVCMGALLVARRSVIAGRQQ